MPKTLRNIYENAVSFENLLLAHKNLLTKVNTFLEFF